MPMTMILFRKMQKTKSGNDASKVNNYPFATSPNKTEKTYLQMCSYDMTVDTFRLSLNKYKLSGNKTWTWLEQFRVM